MKTLGHPCPLSIVMVMFAGGLGLAQSSSVPPDEIGALRGEIARVGVSIEEVSSSLQSLVVLQKTQLMLQRVAFEERRLSPIQRSLGSARSNLQNYQEETERAKEYKTQLEDQIDQVVRSGGTAESAPQNELNQIEREIKRLNEQVERIERRIQELENDLARGRRRLLVLEEQLTSALGEIDE